MLLPILRFVFIYSFDQTALARQRHIGFGSREKAQETGIHPVSRLEANVLSKKLARWQQSNGEALITKRVAKCN